MEFHHYTVDFKEFWSPILKHTYVWHHESLHSDFACKLQQLAVIQFHAIPEDERPDITSFEDIPDDFEPPGWWKWWDEELPALVAEYKEEQQRPPVSLQWMQRR